MAGKNKGGREIRKPKQDKKPKSAEPLGIAPKVAGKAGATKRPG